tara:strand:+ start:22475 stop:22651 length:177 start_codon:yes stop_codon:yes gene_type:complete
MFVSDHVPWNGDNSNAAFYNAAQADMLSDDQGRQASSLTAARNEPGSTTLQTMAMALS